MQKFLLMAAIGLAIIFPGCGHSDSAQQGGAAIEVRGDSTENEVVQVASEFLEAIRLGDSAAASSRLTPLAQQVMRQEDMGFDLLANSTATYRVADVNLIGADEAGVDSVWTEVGTDGSPQQEQWTLGLQRIDDQWRVRGIIADMGANQQPVLMDFENPGQAIAPANTAGAPLPSAEVPQQAARPGAQDPFRR